MDRLENAFIQHIDEFVALAVAIRDIEVLEPYFSNHIVKKCTHIVMDNLQLLFGCLSVCCLYFNFIGHTTKVVLITTTRHSNY